MIQRFMLATLLVATVCTVGYAVDLLGANLAVAKVYGAGGVAGLEGYQTGVFLHAESPLLLTVDSVVLEGNPVTVVNAYGERCEGRVVGHDGPTGLALIECPETPAPPAAFDLTQLPSPRRAQRVWIFSNAFAIAAGDEPVSVQRGRIAALAPLPTDRSEAEYRPAVGVPEPGAPVLLLDAVTRNPGAGGGAVVDQRGELLGVIGAELRSTSTGAWINYAVPLESVRGAVQRIRSGAEDAALGPEGVRRQVRETLARVGLGLIPVVTDRTPAYVERVAGGGLAESAGCQADDLIVAVDGATVGTVEAAGAAITRGLLRSGMVEVAALRENRLVTFTLTEDAP